MMSRTLCIIVLICIFLALSGCGTPYTPIEPNQAVDEGNILRDIQGGKGLSLIAFSRRMGEDPTANGELFVITPNSLFEVQLTFNPGDDRHPAFSPNGRSIAFVSNRFSGAPWGSHDVFRYTPWGGVTQITDEAWQWDSLAVDYGAGFILAARLNTLIGAPFDVVTVTAYDPWGYWSKHIPTGHGASYAPNLNRASKAMVFAARPAGNTYFGSMDIYILYRGETTAHQLTSFGKDPDNMVFSTNPAFDFKGNRVVFQTTLWDGNTEIAYVKLDASIPMPYGPEHVTRVTNNPASDLAPSFSPDGDWIAIATNRDGNFEIYKVWDPNSSGPPPFNPAVRLTNTTEDESDPDWSYYY